MTPEGIVKKLVIKILKYHGAYYYMPVVTAYGKRSVDFICCYKGRMIAIEAKAGNKKPTEQQAKTMREMKEAGCIVLLINEETGTAPLESILYDLAEG